jgi:hypothetical protein
MHRGIRIRPDEPKTIQGTLTCDDGATGLENSNELYTLTSINHASKHYNENANRKSSIHFRKMHDCQTLPLSNTHA